MGAVYGVDDNLLGINSKDINDGTGAMVSNIDGPLDMENFFDFQLSIYERLVFNRLENDKNRSGGLLFLDLVGEIYEGVSSDSFLGFKSLPIHERLYIINYFFANGFMNIGYALVKFISKDTELKLLSKQDFKFLLISLSEHFQQDLFMDLVGIFFKKFGLDIDVLGNLALINNYRLVDVNFEVKIGDKIKKYKTLFGLLDCYKRNFESGIINQKYSYKIYSYLGNFYFNRNRFDLAIGNYKKLGDFGDYSGMHYLLGGLYFRIGKAKESFSHLVEGFVTYNDEGCFKQLLICLIQAGQIDEAHKYMRIAKTRKLEIADDILLKFYRSQISFFDEEDFNYVEAKKYFDKLVTDYDYSYDEEDIMFMDGYIQEYHDAEKLKDTFSELSKLRFLAINLDISNFQYIYFNKVFDLVSKFFLSKNGSPKNIIFLIKSIMDTYSNRGFELDHIRQSQLDEYIGFIEYCYSNIDKKFSLEEINKIKNAFNLVFVIDEELFYFIGAREFVYSGESLSMISKIFHIIGLNQYSQNYGDYSEQRAQKTVGCGSTITDQDEIQDLAQNSTITKSVGSQNMVRSELTGVMTVDPYQSFPIFEDKSIDPLCMYFRDIGENIIKSFENKYKLSLELLLNQLLDNGNKFVDTYGVDFLNELIVYAISRGALSDFLLDNLLDSKLFGFLNIESIRNILAFLVLSQNHSSILILIDSFIRANRQFDDIYIIWALFGVYRNAATCDEAVFISDEYAYLVNSGYLLEYILIPYLRGFESGEIKQDESYLIYHMLGDGNFIGKNYDEAINWYKKSIKSGYTRSYQELARCYEFKGNFDLAVINYKLGIEHGLSVCAYYLSVLLGRLGRHDLQSFTLDLAEDMGFPDFNKALLNFYRERLDAKDIKYRHDGLDLIKQMVITGEYEYEPDDIVFYEKESDTLNSQFKSQSSKSKKRKGKLLNNTLPELNTYEHISLLRKLAFEYGNHFYQEQYFKLLYTLVKARESNSKIHGYDKIETFIQEFIDGSTDLLEFVSGEVSGIDDLSSDRIELLNSKIFYWIAKIYEELGNKGMAKKYFKQFYDLIKSSAIDQITLSTPSDRFIHYNVSTTLN